jgi:hypothetical protein
MSQSISIPEPHVLPIRQVFESVLLALLLVQLQSVSPLVLAAKHHIQNRGDSDQYSVAADDTLPDARVLVADFLRAYPKGTDDVAWE